MLIKKVNLFLYKPGFSNTQGPLQAKHRNFLTRFFYIIYQRYRLHIINLIRNQKKFHSGSPGQKPVFRTLSDPQRPHKEKFRLDFLILLISAIDFMKLTHFKKKILQEEVAGLKTGFFKHSGAPTVRTINQRDLKQKDLKSGTLIT